MINLFKRWFKKPEKPQPRPVWARTVSVANEDDVIMLVSSAGMALGQPVLATIDGIAYPCKICLEVYAPRDKNTAYHAVITDVI